MSDQLQEATLGPPEIDLHPRTKWEQEYHAFRLLLPQLMLTDRGKYVAVHEERVIDSDVDEMALIMRVLGRIGNVDIHVGLVTELPERVYRSGVVRDLSSPPAP
jgi:hypothetical protein